MKYSFEDSWILNSVINSEKKELGAELCDIIAYGDYSNHCIMTLSELNESIKKLCKDGFIVVLKNKKISTTEVYKNWLNKKLEKKTKYSIFKMITETEKFLLKFDQNETYDVSSCDIEFTETEYLIAVQNYKKRFAKL